MKNPQTKEVSARRSCRNRLKGTVCRRGALLLLMAVAGLRTAADSVVENATGAVGVIDTGYSISTRAFTVEAWVWLDDVSGESIFMGQFRGGTTGDFNMRAYNGTVTFFYRGFSDSLPATSEPLTAGAWTHVAMATDGDTASVYLNGVLKGRASRTAGAPITPPTDCNLLLGGHQKTAGYKCRLREVRYWNVCRSDEEIRVNFARELTTPEDGLVARWPLNQSEGLSVENAVDPSRSATLPAAFSWREDAGSPFGEKVLNRNGVYAAQGDGALDTGYTITSGAFTLETWYRPDSVVSGYEEFVFGQYVGSTAGDFSMRLYEGKVQFFYRGFTKGDCWTMPIQAAAWTHLAVSTDGDVCRVYLNGTLATEVKRNLESAPEVLTPPTAHLYLAGRDARTGCRGRLREARYWNVCRTAEEIKQNYLREMTSTEAGLVACWSFAQLSNPIVSNRADASGDLALSAGGSLVEDAANPFHALRDLNAYQCLSLPGGSASVSPVATGLYMATTNFTWEAWVKPATVHAGETAASENRIMGAWAYGNDHGLVLQFSEGRLVAKLRKYASNGLQSTKRARANRWQHVALTSDGFTVRLYLNGAAVGELKKEDSEFKTEDGPYVPCMTSELVLGANMKGATDQTFNGRMADVRVWFRTRTAEEIAADYAHRLSGEEDGLAGYWPLDGESGADSADNYLYPAPRGESAALSSGTWETEPLPFPFRLINPGFMLIIR